MRAGTLGAPICFATRPSEPMGALHLNRFLESIAEALFSNCFAYYSAASLDSAYSSAFFPPLSMLVLLLRFLLPLQHHHQLLLQLIIQLRLWLIPCLRGSVLRSCCLCNLPLPRPLLQRPLRSPLRLLPLQPPPELPPRCLWWHATQDEGYCKQKYCKVL